MRYLSIARDFEAKNETLSVLASEIFDPLILVFDVGGGRTWENPKNEEKIIFKKQNKKNVKVLWDWCLYCQAQL